MIMSAILGILGSVPASLREEMRQRLSHRGLLATQCREDGEIFLQHLGSNAHDGFYDGERIRLVVAGSVYDIEPIRQELGRRVGRRHGRSLLRRPVEDRHDHGEDAERGTGDQSAPPEGFPPHSGQYTRTRRSRS